MGMTIEDAINHIKYGIIQNNYPLQRDLGIEACNLAIDTMRKYQKFQDQSLSLYMERLKADMVTMLSELQLEIEELDTPSNGDAYMTCSEIIQQKINALKEQDNGQDK